MKVIVAEKPEVARAIAAALGGGSNKTGYIECGDYIITHCFGHMVELQEPEEYDPKYKQWKMEDLPLVFVPWKTKVSARSKPQYETIAGLLKKASMVIHACDPDEEGQLILDWILRREKIQVPVKRALINDNSEKAIKRELAEMADNSQFEGLGRAAEARSVADQLYGYNMTRAYTLAARKQGFNDMLNVGRVKTPILGLVVRRDEAFESHKKAFYYVLEGSFAFNGLEAVARYQTAANDPQDEKKRLINEQHVNGIKDAVTGQPATVAISDTKHIKEAPPLPYNLLQLQADAAKKYKLSPAQVKDITQKLREKKLITYNRSDCQYLKEERHGDAPNVFAAIGATAPELQDMIAKADPSIKGRAFNSSKVSAHHAIIPTEETADFSKLTKEEQNIYLLIARAYILQFYPPHEYDRTAVVFDVAGKKFACSTKKVTAPGWRGITGEQSQAEEGEVKASLEDLSSGQEGQCKAGLVSKKETKPNPRYTMETLLKDLPSVAKYVKDERLRALLVEKDKGKEGEHGGIGTPATRDSIIADLIKGEYLEMQGNSVVSTKKGREFYALLPDQAKYPDLTALWSEQQRAIARGELTPEAFIEELIEYLRGEIQRVKEEDLELSGKLLCPACQNPLRRRKGRDGFFWGCSAYPECKKTLPDKDGQPDFTEKKKAPLSEHKCPECEEPLRRIKGKDGYFWGCSAYPGCKATFKDIDGKPALEKASGPSELYNCMVCGKALRRIPGKNGHFWGCSGYKDEPQCKTTYPDLNGKPDYASGK